MSAIEDMSFGEQQLNVGDTMSVEVDTYYSDNLYVFIDDGTEGGQPNQYDMMWSRYSIEDEGWMQFDSRSGVTDFSWKTDSVPHKVKVTIENTSSGSETYRMELASLTVARQ